MIGWLLAAILAAAAGIAIALYAYSRAYVRRVEAHWPALGQCVDAEGMRLHTMAEGPEDAQRLLLIHGASANLRELWGPLAQACTDDLRVIAYDRPGYGHSTRPRRGAHALKSQARVAARVLEEAGGGPAIVAAHSLGAAVALRLALDRPDLVRGLVLIAPASHPYPGDNVWWARLSAMPILGDLFCTLIVPWAGPIIGRGGIANNFYPSDTPKGYFEDAGVGLVFRPRAFRASAKDVVATKQEFAAQAPLYPEIMAPTVIVTGDKDRVVSPKIHARALASEMAAAELVIAPSAGHMPHRLRTDLVIAAIRRVQVMVTASAEG